MLPLGTEKGTEMVQITAMTAARLIQQAYDGKIRGQSKSFKSKNGAEGYLRKDGLLVIPGSQGVNDYLKFNLQIFKFKFTNKNSKMMFHAGFLKHCNELLEFARENNVKYVAGHSLGAASSQLLAATLGIPALNFAAPKVMRQGFRAKHGGQVVNINRKDDLVGHVPKLLFKHIGKTYWLDCGPEDGKFDHALSRYVEAMEMASVQKQVPFKFA